MLSSCRSYMYTYSPRLFTVESPARELRACRGSVGNSRNVTLWNAMLNATIIKNDQNIQSLSYQAMSRTTRQRKHNYGRECQFTKSHPLSSLTSWNGLDLLTGSCSFSSFNEGHYNMRWSPEHCTQMRRYLHDGNRHSPWFQAKHIMRLNPLSQPGTTGLQCSMVILSAPPCRVKFNSFCGGE